MSSGGLRFFKKQQVIFLSKEFVTESDGSALGPVLPPRGQLAMSGDIFGYYSQGMEVLLALGGWRPEMLPDVPQCGGPAPPQTITWTPACNCQRLKHNSLWEDLGLGLKQSKGVYTPNKGSQV